MLKKYQIEKDEHNMSNEQNLLLFFKLFLIHRNNIFFPFLLFELKIFFSQILTLNTNSLIIDLKFDFYEEPLDLYITK